MNRKNEGDCPTPRRHVKMNPPRTMAGAQPSEGKITDCTPWRYQTSRKGWGQYAFQAQRIEWDAGYPEVRLVYYRRNSAKDSWRFASQTTIMSAPAIIATVCRDVLAKKWS